MGKNGCGDARRWPAAATALTLAALIVLLAALPGRSRGREAEPQVQAFLRAATFAGRHPVRDPQEAREQLQRLERQVGELERRLEGLGERRAGLVEEFEAADVRLALSRRHLRVVRLRLDAITRDARERRAEVERLDLGLGRARDQLARRVVALYRMGPLSYSRVLLAADTADEVLAGYQLVTRLAAQDRSMVASVRLRLAERREALAALEQTRRHLEEARREEAAAVEDLHERQEQRQELIRRIDVEAAESRRALARRQEDAEEMAGLVANLTAPADDATASDAAGPPAASFEATAGRLPWPGQGEVTLSFGRQRHPVYDTYTLSKGIEIAATVGSPVRAVFPGRVVFADWFQSYGLVVILDHGNDWFTIYGHLDRVDVHVGDRVEARGQVATVGDSGSLTGPSLYFEIRRGTEALNPGNWLRPR